jgi:DHA1 family inner membrane transport protein
MPAALYALTAGAFGIGVTEFVIMGLLIEVGAELRVSVAAAGLLISGYALGVVVGAPVLTAITARWRHKTVLIILMAIFTTGNLAGTVKLSEENTSVPGIGLDQAALAMPVTSAQT